MIGAIGVGIWENRLGNVKDTQDESVFLSWWLLHRAGAGRSSDVGPDSECLLDSEAIAYNNILSTYKHKHENVRARRFDLCILQHVAGQRRL